jgi:CRP-like cAMP-binding protein
MALQSDVMVFQANALLGQFEPDALRLLAFSSEPRTFKTGATLFKLGERSDGGLLIISGSVILSGAGPDEIVGEGALLGEAALFTDTTRPVTATAKDTVVVQRIPRHLVKRVLAEYPGTAPRLKAYFSSRLSGMRETLEQIDALLPG